MEIGNYLFKRFDDVTSSVESMETFSAKLENDLNGQKIFYDETAYETTALVSVLGFLFGLGLTSILFENGFIAGHVFLVQNSVMWLLVERSSSRGIKCKIIFNSFIKIQCSPMIFCLGKTKAALGPQSGLGQGPGTMTGPGPELEPGPGPGPEPGPGPLSGRNRGLVPKARVGSSGGHPLLKF